MQQKQLAADNAWWGATLTLVVTLGITAAIFGLWYQDRMSGRQPIEQFLPVSSGLTLNYRVSKASAAPSYQMSNIARLQGQNALNEIPVQIQMHIVAPLLGVNADAIDSEQYAVFLRNQSQQVIALRELSTSVSAAGPMTTTKQLLLVQASTLSLLAVNNTWFTPAIPILDLNMLPGQTQTTSGSFGQGAGYTSTLTYERREALDTPLGKQQDCRRTHLLLQIGAVPTELRSWYCAGLGLARQELLNNTEQQELYELVGANTPALRSFVEQPALQGTHSVAQHGLQGRGFYEDHVGGELDWVWSYREPGGLIQAITSPPTIDQQLVYVGTASGLILALDRISHQVRWRFQTGDAIVAAPTLDAGIVYVSSTDRQLYALDANTGFLRWVFATGDAISGAAAVGHGMVYIGSEDRQLYALNVDTGKEVWHFTAGDAITAMPSLLDRWLYIGSDDGAMYALDAVSGTLRWAFATDSAITAPALVDNGVVYIGSNDGFVYALKAQSSSVQGEQLWSFNTYAAITDAMLLHNGLLYVQNDDSIINALDLQGKQRWRHANELTLYGPPLLLGKQLLIHEREALLAFDAETGSLIRRIATATNGYAPIGSDGRELFVGHRSGFISAFGNSSALPWRSQPRWVATELSNTLFTAEDMFLSPPVVDQQNLLMVSANGRVYRIARADGQANEIAKINNLGTVLLAPTLAERSLLIGDQYGKLVALDLDTGTERWRASVPGRSFSPALIQADQLLFSSTDPDTHVSIVSAFSLSDGQQRWQQRFPFQLSVGSSAILHHGRYYVVADQLHALDPRSGETIWQSTGTFTPYQISAAGDMIYAVGFDANFQLALAAFDANTGKQQYVKRIEAVGFPLLHGGISAAGNSIVLSMVDNTTLVLDASTGTLSWKVVETAAHTGPPTLVGDTLLRVGLDGRLIARKLSDGSLRADFLLQEASSTALESVMQAVVADQTLYSAFYQHVFALDLVAER